MAYVSVQAHTHSATPQYHLKPHKVKDRKTAALFALCPEVCVHVRAYVCAGVRACICACVCTHMQDTEREPGQGEMYSVLCCSSIMEACCIMTAQTQAILCVSLFQFFH